MECASRRFDVESLIIAVKVILILSNFRLPLPAEGQNNRTASASKNRNIFFFSKNYFYLPPTLAAFDLFPILDSSGGAEFLGKFF